VLFIGFAGTTFIPGLAQERRQFVAEVFGTTKEIADGYGDTQARMGLRYAAVEDLALDAAIGRSFTSHSQVEFFPTIGLTWIFDAPWKCCDREADQGGKRCVKLIVGFAGRGRSAGEAYRPLV
jgi:hypothetical protein